MLRGENEIPALFTDSSGRCQLLTFLRLVAPKWKVLPFDALQRILLATCGDIHSFHELFQHLGKPSLLQHDDDFQRKALEHCVPQVLLDAFYQLPDLRLTIHTSLDHNVQGCMALEFFLSEPQWANSDAFFAQRGDAVLSVTELNAGLSDVPVVPLQQRGGHTCVVNVSECLKTGHIVTDDVLRRRRYQSIGMLQPQPPIVGYEPRLYRIECDENRPVLGVPEVKAGIEIPPQLCLDSDILVNCFMRDGGRQTPCFVKCISADEADELAFQPNHANIIKRFSFCKVEFRAFSYHVAIEPFDESLSSYVQRVSSAFSLEERLQVIHDVACALEYVALLTELEHGDISPDDVVLCRGTWKLLGFGFLRRTWSRTQICSRVEAEIFSLSPLVEFLGLKDCLIPNLIDPPCSATDIRLHVELAMAAGPLRFADWRSTCSTLHHVLVRAACKGVVKVVPTLFALRVNLSAVDETGLTALHHAARHGRVGFIVALRNYGVTSSDVTLHPLWVALEHGDPAVVERCFANLSADANMPLATRTSLLMRAAAKGLCVTTLTQLGFDVNAVDEYGRNALWYAAAQDHPRSPKRVERLLHFHSAVTADAVNGWTPLHVAARNGCTAVLRNLVENSPPAVLLQTDHSGRTAAMVAACVGHVEPFCYLMTAGSCRDAVDNRGYSLMHHTVAKGRLNSDEYTVRPISHKRQLECFRHTNSSEQSIYRIHLPDHLGVLRFLLEGNEASDTPLDASLVRLAAELGHLDVVEYLHDRNFPMAQPDDTGHTPISLAALRGHVTCVEYLLEKGCAVGGSETLCSPLIAAVSGGHAAAFTALLRSSTTERSCVDRTGHTPLSTAVEHERTDFVESLLDAGADACQKNAYGDTAFHIAADFDRLPCLTQLLSRERAGVDCLDRDGRIPLERAVLRSNIDCIRLLAKRSRLASGFTSAVHLAVDKAHYGSWAALHALLDASDTQNGAASAVAVSASLHSVRKNYLAVLRCLVDHHHITLHEIDSKGLTALYVAIDARSSDAVVQLILDVMPASGRCTQTLRLHPLKLAATRKLPSLSQRILDAQIFNVEDPALMVGIDRSDPVPSRNKTKMETKAVRPRRKSFGDDDDGQSWQDSVCGCEGRCLIA